MVDQQLQSIAKDLVTINVHITIGQRAWLRAIASARGRGPDASVAAIVREAIDAYMAKEAQP